MEQFGTEALSSLMRNTTMEWQERLQVYIFLYQAIIPPDHLLPIGTSAYHFFESYPIFSSLVNIWMWWLWYEANLQTILQ